jgi:hypothetical protein
MIEAEHVQHPLLGHRKSGDEAGFKKLNAFEDKFRSFLSNLICSEGSWKKMSGEAGLSMLTCLLSRFWERGESEKIEYFSSKIPFISLKFRFMGGAGSE